MSAKQLLQITTFAMAYCASAFAQQTPVKVTGVFSGLNYIEEAGDLVGVEVFVFFAGEHRVLFQESIGEPMEPSLVKAKVNGDSIEFTVPEVGGGHKTFKGKVTKTHLVGKWAGSKETISLPRKKSYWQ